MDKETFTEQYNKISAEYPGGKEAMEKALFKAIELGRQTAAENSDLQKKIALAMASRLLFVWGMWGATKVDEAYDSYQTFFCKKAA